MSSGLTHTGAIARGLAYAPDPKPRALPSADTVARARRQIRDEAMTERGINPLSLYVASPQDRVRAEMALQLDTAARTLTAEDRRRAYVRATGTLVDLRV